ncbi:XopAG/AvrGf1 family type III secretion system effector [Herbaspirillum huttiense]|uniref:XopAG/AvrGf1 family type III secretion system effector n=2 Tax=Herbaspirillum huttiense TaxID=863372 RepID=A0AAJ2HD22_9BURK|nr:XopAG/AvrGf1 family type III secretion system effector [Herbaspirillum huttiense]MDR9838211.1 XopAG/AvrGf1 family type III secretion system effector [Herbaspirillum huttiense]
MRFHTHLSTAAFELAQVGQSQAQRPAGTVLKAAATAMEAPLNTKNGTEQAPHLGGQKKAGDGGMRNWNSRRMKYVLGLAGAAYAYDQVTNNFFLSTTALHDDKQGFTSNERLDRAKTKAEHYLQRYEKLDSESRARDFRPSAMARRVGNNQFLTMTDYRSAVRTYLSRLVDSGDSYQSVAKSIACLKGERVKQESLERYQPAFVPQDPDLTKSPLYGKKGKYSLSGVFNEGTGSTGYASRSITHPFVLKGYSDFVKISEEKGWTPRQCVDDLEAKLSSSTTLDEKSQFAAGRAILNLRQVYAHEQYWGHAENVIMKMLADNGFLSPEETLKLDQSLMFEDPNKSVLTRNASVMGPALHRLESRFHQWRLRDDLAALEDLKPMIDAKNIENMPLAHFKVNESFDGFEDSSGLGDSFTCANAAACINHARLMSGEERMSEADIIALIGCLYPIYADASGMRHTLQEVSRGCFAGAGYLIEDADRFYERICREASLAFYGGKNA